MAEPRFAKSIDDLLSQEELLSMSGLDFINGIKEGRLPAPPIAKLMGYRMTEVELGRVVFRGAPHFDVMNPIGSVHGGWYGTLLDSCMACAIQTKLPVGQAYTTLEYKVNILRGAQQGGQDILAIGEAVHVGRRTATAEGRMVGAEDGKLYATGTTTCIVLGS